ncbi:DUF6134 family protein [Hyphomonas sp.]|uniref:DUF6134 family protein n=1 Tax=Hyphomonas sp. TaxID=87 RepID=UPI003D2AD6EC
MIRHTLTTLSLALLAIPALADTAPTPNAASAPPPPVWTPKDGDEIRFDVLRNGKPFGSHSVAFDLAADGTLTATTGVRLKAGLGPITVFKYELDATETWKQGQLVGLTGAVDDSGKDGSVEASRDGETLQVKGTEYSGAVPLGILPSSHWNIAQTEATQLLSTEDGELIKVNVEDKGADTVMVGGQAVDARRYMMDSDIDVDLWYDDQGRWVKLAFEARGQQIEYALTQYY